MFTKWQLARKYLHYYLTSSNGKGHGTHSPFIFHFITRVLNEKKHFADYDRVEALRSGLLKDETVLTLEDFGAGSAMNKTNQRSVARIAKNAAKPKKYGQLLYRMAREYQPAVLLELGTSLGITTAYLGLAKPDAQLVTMEGATAVAAMAKKNFQSLGLQHIKIIEGNFDLTLPGLLEALPVVDLGFIDGNHRREPTESYFRDLLPKTGNETILVFDDIHWSPDMEMAWETIKADPAVTCTIDLLFIGIVFFRQEFREKQHFSIRF